MSYEELDRELSRQVPRRRKVWDTNEHETAIAKLCADDPELQRTGFRKAILARFTHTGMEGDWRLRKTAGWLPPKLKPIPREDLIDDLRIVPDAWKIVDKEIRCFEIVHTATLTPPRREAYGYLWFSLEYFHIDLRLFVGSTSVEGISEIDLQDWYFKYALGAFAKAAR